MTTAAILAVAVPVLVLAVRTLIEEYAANQRAKRERDRDRNRNGQS